jgi:hypothetical protein
VLRKFFVLRKEQQATNFVFDLSVNRRGSSTAAKISRGFGEPTTPGIMGAAARLVK